MLTGAMRFLRIVAASFVSGGVALAPLFAQDRSDHCVALGPVVLDLPATEGILLRPAAATVASHADRCTEIVAAESLTFNRIALTLADPAMRPVRDAYVYHDPGYDKASVVMGFCLGLNPSHAQQLATGFWHYTPANTAPVESWVLANPVLRVDCYARLPNQSSQTCSYQMRPGGGLMVKGGFALNDLPPENFAAAFGAMSRYLHTRALDELLPMLPQDKMLQPVENICPTPR